MFAKETNSEELWQSDNLTVTMTLTDVNDNNPGFLSSSYSFLVNNSVTQGTVIGQVGRRESGKRSHWLNWYVSKNPIG